MVPKSMVTTDNPSSGPVAAPPLVSVVIPCYNASEFVEEAISSAFAQTIENVEVIVVDDGSTDRSYELLQELRDTKFPFLQILTHEGRANLGVSSSRLKGCLDARSELIAFLDADDRFKPGKLAAQVKVMRSNPEVVLCHTSIQVIGDLHDARAYDQIFSDSCHGPYVFRKRPDYLKRNCICNSSVIVRASALKNIPFAMPQLFQYEDWLLWCLLSGRGRFFFLAERLTEYRIHANSATAAVVRNELRQHYSLLEMKLALIAKSETSFHAIRALASAFETVVVLISRYSKAPVLGIGVGETEKNAVMLGFSWMKRARRAVKGVSWFSRR